MVARAVRLVMLFAFTAWLGDRSAAYALLWAAGVSPAQFVAGSAVSAVASAGIALLAAFARGRGRVGAADPARAAHSRAMFAKYRAALKVRA